MVVSKGFTSLKSIAILIAFAALGLGIWKILEPAPDSNVNVVSVTSAVPQDTSVYVVIDYDMNKKILAHYTEHLAWLPNIGKDSRPEDRDSNAWTNDYAVGYWLSGPPEDLTDMLRRLKGVFDPIDLPRSPAALVLSSAKLFIIAVHA